jgi:hypothetical protein
VERYATAARVSQVASVPESVPAYRPKFPLEVGETVWIVKPEFRAPVGEFRVSKAHPNDRFELVNMSDNTVYPELVEGKFLHRNPYAPGS